MGNVSARPRIVVTGADGQVGRLIARTPGAVGLGRAALDITDAHAVGRWGANLTPDDVIVNCAAHTAVDAAESDVAAAVALNVDGPGHLARACAGSGARLVHLSTDYVFDGRGHAPYEPDDVAPEAHPDSVYGQTKLAGERAARDADPRSTIVRTAWVYTGSAAASDFVSTMRRLERERETVSVVSDQLGSPTYAVDLAAGLVELATRGRAVGATVHATNAGACTWHELARAVFVELGADPDRVLPVTTAEFPRPAPRPAYSVLSPRSWTAAGLTPLRDWRSALADAVGAGGEHARRSR